MPGLLSANGRLTVSFAPAVATDRCVFRLWPNSPFYAARGAGLTVRAVTSGGRALPIARPDPTTLVVRRALAAHERITVSMDWSLRLPKTPGVQLHGGRDAAVGLYVRTVQALAALGSAATVSCALRAFVVGNAYRTAVPRDLLAWLRRFLPDPERKLRARGAQF
jgi:hypothetical protein